MQYTQEQIKDIYERNLPSVYKLCMSYMRNKTDAEDAVQNTFLKLIASGKTFGDANYEKAWLLRTAINTCKDKLRHWWGRTIPIDENILSADADSDDLAVINAVMALPEKYRTVIFLYYYEGYRSDEAGKILGIPAATVRTRLSRAKTYLKDELKGDFYE